MHTNSAQEELHGQLVSPQVHANRRVTFRLRAPRASEVAVEGIAGLEPQPMRQGSDDVWEVTVGPLEPELYSYSFRIDGAVVTDPHNRQVKKWLSLDSMFLVPGDPPLLHEQQSVPHGVVHHHLRGSQAAGREMGLYVYTPPSYRGGEGRQYPLLILMHGYGDDASAWLEVGRMNAIVDNLLARDDIQPMIVAMPYGHPLPIDLDQEFDDYADRNLVLMQQDVIDQLVPFIASRYAVKQDRRHRAIVGLSMGGGQSLTIGLGHLDQFAWLGGFSSAAPQGDLNQQFAALTSDRDAVNQQLQLLWIGCGKEDFLLERNRRFVQWLADHRIEHIYRETEGGHDWMVWRKDLAEFLPLLFRD